MTSVLPLPAESSEIDSPLFNYSNTEGTERNSLFSVCAEDDDPNATAYLNDPSFTERKRSVMSAVEVDGLAESDFRDRGRVADKPANDFARIIQQIKQIVLFEGFDDEELKLVADYMYLHRVVKDEVVIKIGSVGDAIYVVKSGSFKCVVPGPDGKEAIVKTYKDEGYFGELALINHAPRAATITALTNGELWVLQALRHSWLRKKRAMDNAERFEQLIKAIPLFRDNLNASLTSKLIDALELLNLSPGEVICRQGDNGDAMFFIMKGEVDVAIDKKSVSVMAKNQFFGERALVLDEGRAATCSAKTKVSIAKLPKESFQLIIPDAVVSKMQQHARSTYGKSPAAKTTGAKTPGTKTPAGKSPPFKSSSHTSLAAKPASSKTPSPKSPSMNSIAARTPSPKSPSMNSIAARTPSPKSPSTNSIAARTPSPKSPSMNSTAARTPSPKSPSMNSTAARTPSPKSPSMNLTAARTPSPKSPTMNSTAAKTPLPKSPPLNSITAKTPSPKSPPDAKTK